MQLLCHKTFLKKEYPLLNRIKKEVARSLLPRLIKVTGTERILRDQVYSKEFLELQNKNASVHMIVSKKPDPKLFADYVAYATSQASATDLLNRLVNAGLIGHGIVVEADLGEGEKINLRLDNYFYFLAEKFEPNLSPEPIEEY